MKKILIYIKEYLYSAGAPLQSTRLFNAADLLWISTIECANKPLHWRSAYYLN